MFDPVTGKKICKHIREATVEGEYGELGATNMVMILKKKHLDDTLTRFPKIKKYMHKSSLEKR